VIEHGHTHEEFRFCVQIVFLHFNLLVLTLKSRCYFVYDSFAIVHILYTCRWVEKFLEWFTARFIVVAQPISCSIFEGNTHLFTGSIVELSHHRNWKMADVGNIIPSCKAGEQYFWQNLIEMCRLELGWKIANAGKCADSNGHNFWNTESYRGFCIGVPIKYYTFLLGKLELSTKSQVIKISFQIKGIFSLRSDGDW